MAPLAARLASARAMARHARIRVTAIEQKLGTTHTADTIAQLQRLYPHCQFLWLMGADNLAQFHRWQRWRAIARMVPIVVFARPGYSGVRHAAPAMAWLRQHQRRNAAQWRNWTLPAIILVHFGLDPRSATAVRRVHPDWAHASPYPQPEDRPC
jgi:nicotinate-nucleotide adenylyltransferase